MHMTKYTTESLVVLYIWSGPQDIQDDLDYPGCTEIPWNIRIYFTFIYMYILLYNMRMNFKHILHHESIQAIGIQI
jgi:hypothetical protein